MSPVKKLKRFSIYVFVPMNEKLCGKYSILVAVN